MQAFLSDFVGNEHRIAARFISVAQPTCSVFFVDDDENENCFFQN